MMGIAPPGNMTLQSPRGARVATMSFTVDEITIIVSIPSWGAGCDQTPQEKEKEINVSIPSRGVGCDMT